MNRLIALTGIFLISTGIASGQDLKTYKVTYEKRLEQIIMSHGMKMTDLGQQYSNSLNALLAKIKKTGDLEKTVAVMDEIERFQKEKAMPEKPSELAYLKNMQSSFTKQATDHENAKAKSILTLTSQFDKALDRLQRGLVSSDKLDEAKEVQRERKATEESGHVKAAKARLGNPTLPPTNKPLTIIANAKPTDPATLSTSSKGWTSLADVDPEYAKVGYGKLDRYGTATKGIGIGGKTFKTGMMAHASSSLVYKLDKKYTTFSTSYGMKNGAGGSAIFYVLVDGKEKFKSGGMWSYGKTKTRGHKPMSINISNADKLELKTVGVRGGAGAWSAWGDPQIK